MSIGVSYFGNRILRHVEADMDDLVARGFDGVLHTFSENDLHWYRQQMTRIVEVSKRRGLEVQIGPWGFGHLFGGEAESLLMTRHPEWGQVFADGRHVGAACPSRPEVRTALKEWATAAVELGADRVFWDEPHWAHPVRFDQPAAAWTCICDACKDDFTRRYDQQMPGELTPEVQQFREQVLTEMLGELLQHVAGLGGRSTVCLLPPVDGLHAVDSWSDVAALPGLDTLCTDPYWSFFGQDPTTFVGELARRVVDLSRTYDLNPQIWIQGFGLSPAQGPEIREAVAAARQAGVTDLWTWGYEACGHMSHLKTKEPQKVWDILSDAMTTPAGMGISGRGI